MHKVKLNKSLFFLTKTFFGLSQRIFKLSKIRKYLLGKMFLKHFIDMALFFWRIIVVLQIFFNGLNKLT